MRSELNIAKEAAIEAGRVILNYYNGDYEIQEKGYHNPVTTADHEADTRLKEILLNARPDYGWLSEETVDSRERLEKERVWVVDPLDGTKEFIEGVPHFVVSIALVESGQPTIGILYNPVTGETFTAAQDEGACLNRFTVQTGTFILSCCKGFAGHWIVQDTDSGLTAFYQSNAYNKMRHPFDKFLRSIQRIHYPHVFFIQSFLRVHSLFRKPAIIWSFF